MLTDTVGGVSSNSLAVLTDAAHQFSDIASFVFSIAAIQITTNPRCCGRTAFGTSRADAIGALVAILIIWILVGLLIYESIKRIIHIDDVKIDGRIMLLTSGIGLFFKLVNLFVLEHMFNSGEQNTTQLKEKVVDETQPEEQPTKELLIQPDSNVLENNEQSQAAEQQSAPQPKPKVQINIRAAQIHLFGDVIQAVIFVLAAVLIIYRPDWKLVDPITTFVFAVLVIGWHMLPFSMDCMKVLMELQPENLNSK